MSAQTERQKGPMQTYYTIYEEHRMLSRNYPVMYPLPGYWICKEASLNEGRQPVLG
jgi:hypothetical protein